MSFVTASELYDQVRYILDDSRIAPDMVNRTLHTTLVTVCATALRDTHHAFGDLNSQLEAVIRRHHIDRDEANAMRQMRRHSNHSEVLPPADRLADALALARLVSHVMAEPLPPDLTRLLSHGPVRRRETVRANTPDRRCIVSSWDRDTIRVVVDEDGADTDMTVRYTDATQHADMGYLFDLLKEGMHLNLLGCEQEGDVLRPRMIIVEPDCLLDISTIASCFEDYGHHPLLYLVSRMREKANSQAILLGNFAGSALDDSINNPDFSLAHTLMSNFREKALEYSTCPDFDAEQFKHDAATQTQNLRQVVDELRQHYDMDRAILEPSFICEKLGIQGRVDLMTTDLKLLVEQKSGRNILLERNVPNRHGARVVEKHYVQVMLYFSILYYNFGLSHTDVRLLYSKYPLPGGLIGVAQLMRLIYEAVRFRNEAVALEFYMAEHGPTRLLPLLTADHLNVAHSSGFFYDTYLRPPLERTLAPLHQMSPTEHAYFCRMLQFSVRENLMSKVGVVEGVGSSVANLWNMPLAEKRETGNIYTHLTITKKEKSGGEDGYNGYDLITLHVGDQGDDFLPNFRRGDMVYLYAYPTGQEPDVRRALLFKGALSEIRTDAITVMLADGQQNVAVFDHLPYGGLQLSNDPGARPEQHFSWCVEHGGSDVGGSAAIRALYELITAPQSRRDLLLGQRAPQADTTLTLSRSYDPQLDPMLLQARQARDFFLLVGPPGTGKTSRALRFMVEEALAGEGGDLLLLSYTNRAVDEICGMLEEAGIDYIRLGHELSCAPQFVPHLVSHVVGEKPRLDTMRRQLLGARVVVATTSMLQARPFLFSLKHFALAIVDESSQILEPSIVGLLASHRATEGATDPDACNIDKFILIGDYKQLPAVVQQNDKDAAVTDPLLQAIGLDSCRNSLFERLIRQEQRSGRTQFVGTLRLQGRMHPEIAYYPGHEFYFSEQIKPVPLSHQKETTIGYDLPAEDATDELLCRHRLLFFASRDCRQPELSDKVNTDEARIVADMLRRIHRFYGAGFDPEKTVGVIVPYRNQIAMIRKELEHLGLPELEGVSIDTVERYQGSQRDVIIYSFTVQQRYQLDFLTANTFEEDGHVIDRKLNVALTRARRQLILTGNPRTLRHAPVFARLMEYIRGIGGLVEAKEQ